MSLLGRMLGAPLDFALPKRCAGCGEITADRGSFCPSCWAKLDFLPDHGCVRCNVPVHIAGTICGPCLQDPPRHDGVLAAIEYGDIARALALQLKYGRKARVADVMADLMARNAARYPEAILVPVPLHRWRIWQRGFNQSLLIARNVARLTGQDVRPAPIIRVRRTSPLGGLNPSARRREVGGAFRMEPKEREHIAGRDVLLVDDVYTTGATANACAGILKRAGAKSVRILEALSDCICVEFSGLGGRGICSGHRRSFREGSA